MLQELTVMGWSDWSWDTLQLVLAVVCPTTIHDDQQRMNGQFLFYLEYKAIYLDKSAVLEIAIMKAYLETDLEQSVSVTPQWLTPDIIDDVTMVPLKSAESDWFPAAGFSFI